MKRFIVMLAFAITAALSGCGGTAHQDYLSSRDLAQQLSQKTTQFQELNAYLVVNQAAFTRDEWSAISRSLMSLTTVFSLANEFSQQRDSPELLRSLNRAVHIAAVNYEAAYNILRPNIDAASPEKQAAAIELDATLRALYAEFSALPLTNSVDVANQTISTAISVAGQAAILYKTVQGF